MARTAPAHSSPESPSPCNATGGKTAPGLSGVPETLLWTLYNRAAEARRPDGVLRDPDAVRICDALDYDYRRHFGAPEGAHAMRAAAIDRVLRSWLERHPDGFVVSLGEGLETQSRRLDNARLRWLTVDLPEVMALRERFLPPTDRFRHLALSALDRGWMDEVEPSKGVFVVAQGLFMYLPPDEVRRLLVDIAERFPGAELMFDVIPRWFSRLTLRGFKRTRHYRLPPMPWGIDANEIAPTLKSWHPRIAAVEVRPFLSRRGFASLIQRLFLWTPGLRRKVPNLVHVTIGP